MNLVRKFSAIFAIIIVLSGCSFNFKSETVYDTSKLDLDNLPIGTVIKGKGSDKKIMIYANNPVRSTDGKKYRYVGVFYPEGFTSEEANMFFDPKHIEKVYHLGYEEK